MIYEFGKTINHIDELYLICICITKRFLYFEGGFTRVN